MNCMSFVMTDLFASSSGPEGAKCFQIPLQPNRPGMPGELGVGVIVA